MYTANRKTAYARGVSFTQEWSWNSYNSLLEIPQIKQIIISEIKSGII